MYGRQSKTTLRTLSVREIPSVTEKNVILHEKEKEKVSFDILGLGLVHTVQRDSLSSLIRQLGSKHHLHSSWHTIVGDFFQFQCKIVLQ